MQPSYRCAESARLAGYPAFVPSLLAALHPHADDAMIRFEEAEHLYTVQWEDGGGHSEAGICSVSKLVHRFFPTFDPDGAIAMIRRSKRAVTIKKYAGMTDDEIRAKWEADGSQARDNGTFLHFLLECDQNGYQLDCSPYQNIVQVRQYLRWKHDFFTPSYRPLRTEFRMKTDASTKITGTADLLAVNIHSQARAPPGTLLVTVFDWKFSKGVKFDNMFESGLDVCANLPNVNGVHYSLQQNMYANMLETYTGLQFEGRSYERVVVEALYLAVFHPNFSPTGKLVEIVRDQGMAQTLIASAAK